MWDANRLACVTYNGEIYNFRELRDECRRAGFAFKSSSDTEVIVNQYLLHGSQRSIVSMAYSRSASTTGVVANSFWYATPWA